MAIAPPSGTGPAEYLAAERAARDRHELIDGEVVAMSGASRQHDAIACNLLASLHGQLKARGWPCRPHSSDMKVRVPDSSLYTYPDLSVVCGEPLYEDAQTDVLLNPTVLVEVLSPSTAAFDRGEKWERYRTIASLREYVLVAQDRLHVERFQRRDDGTWLFSEQRQATEVLRLESIACALSLADLYEGVELGDAPERSSPPA